MNGRLSQEVSHELRDKQSHGVPVSYTHLDVYKRQGQGVEVQSATGQEMNISSDPSEFPIEYQELWTELKACGVNGFMFPTYIPEDFQLDDSDLYIQPKSNKIDFAVWYKNGNSDITYTILYDKDSNKVYEKDDGNVEVYKHEDTEYYIFSNYDRNVAAWYMGCLLYTSRCV